MDLLRGTANALDLSWSPAGRFFTFADAPNVTSQVTRIHTRGLGRDGSTAITDGRTNAWSPSWSADGRTPYFVQNRGGAMDLWQQPMTGAGQPAGNPLALTTGMDMRQAAFSRDGRRLAYSKSRRRVP